MAERAGDSRTQRRDLPDAVMAAARRKFLHFGVARTTMADISRDVGMPRQAIYDYVASREALVECVLIQRIKEIAEELKQVRTGSFAESLVEMAVVAIRKAKEDPELTNLVETGPKDVVQKVVVGHCQEVHDTVVDLLRPILDRAAAAGRLRTDKTRDEIVDWVRIVFLALISQTSMEPQQERSIIAGFLLPSVIGAHA